jgi:hypothetical protein
MMAFLMMFDFKMLLSNTHQAEHGNTCKTKVRFLECGIISSPGAWQLHQATDTGEPHKTHNTLF